MGELLEWLIEWLTILAQVIAAIGTLLAGAASMACFLKSLTTGIFFHCFGEAMHYEGRHFLPGARP